MNRLQKKCLIATAGGHFLLILILLIGPGFFTSKTVPEDAQILTFIPDLTATFTSGDKNAQLPAPTPPRPIVQPTPQPPPTPPQPVVKPVEPVRQPEPEPEPPKVVEQPTPDAVEPLPKPKPKPKPVTPVISLKPFVRKVPPKTVDNTEAENEAKAEAKALKDAQHKAAVLANAINSIQSHSSKPTVVGLPGTGAASYARYSDKLGTIFYDAWTPPNDASNENAITKVSVTIAGDGTILTWRIVEPSGDASVDASVRRAMDRVPSVPPLPDGAKQRTISIYFNLNTKRMLG